MYLYNLTLQKGTGVTHAVHGNFSGGKHQEVILSRGKSLELVRPDSNTGKVHTVLSVEVFGCIRALMSFRLTGGTKGEFKIFNLNIFFVARIPIELSYSIENFSKTYITVKVQ